MSQSRFPQEIVDLVLRWLPKNDLLTLNRLSRNCYLQTLSKLYDHVVFTFVFAPVEVEDEAARNVRLSNLRSLRQIVCPDGYIDWRPDNFPAGVIRQVTLDVDFRGCEGSGLWMTVDNLVVGLVAKAKGGRLREFNFQSRDGGILPNVFSELPKLNLLALTHHGASLKSLEEFQNLSSLSVQVLVREDAWLFCDVLKTNSRTLRKLELQFLDCSGPSYTILFDNDHRLRERYRGLPSLSEAVPEGSLHLTHLTLIGGPNTFSTSLLKAVDPTELVELSVHCNSYQCAFRGSLCLGISEDVLDCWMTERSNSYGRTHKGCPRLKRFHARGHRQNFDSPSLEKFFRECCGERTMFTNSYGGCLEDVSLDYSMASLNGQSPPLPSLYREGVNKRLEYHSGQRLSLSCLSGHPDLQHLALSLPSPTGSSRNKRPSLFTDLCSLTLHNTRLETLSLVLPTPTVNCFQSPSSNIWCSLRSLARLPWLSTLRVLFPDGVGVFGARLLDILAGLAMCVFDKGEQKALRRIVVGDGGAGFEKSWDVIKASSKGDTAAAAAAGFGNGRCKLVPVNNMQSFPAQWVSDVEMTL